MAKIMIVEDEEQYMAQIAGIVTGSGHEPLPFSGYKQALEAYGTERPDMVITDYTGDYSGFPLGGITVAAEIRRRGDTIPIYVQSRAPVPLHELNYCKATGFIPKSELGTRLPAVLAEHFGGSE